MQYIIINLNKLFSVRSNKNRKSKCYIHSPTISFCLCKPKTLNFITFFSLIIYFQHLL